MNHPDIPSPSPSPENTTDCPDECPDGPQDEAGLHVTNLSHLSRRVREEGLKVFGADALGLPLHSNGHLGADILHVPAHASFPVHTHPGDHLLLCLQGTGTISIGERTYTVGPGDLYMVPGQVPHAVGAGKRAHVLVAIGAPHKPVASPERMTFTDWAGTELDTPLFHTAADDR